MLIKVLFAVISTLFIRTQSFQSRFLARNARTTFQMSVDITPALVKELRDKSGAGMMDCRKALAESGGDLDGAVDWLRKKGIAAVAKKAGRVASSGLVGVATSADNKAAAVVEINSETDFVARNELFQAMVSQVCAIAAETPCDKDSLLTTKYDATSTVSDAITNAVATIGENMNLRRVQRLSVDNGQVVTYMHNPTKASLGKIGVAVALESPAGPCETLADLGKKLALHIAASSPEALTIAEVLPEKLERERNVLVEQARSTGKPEAAIEKMVEGRIRKYYEEVVLLEQPFVMDGKVKVSELVKQTAKTLGSEITLKGFCRLMLGDGVEKPKEE